MSRCYGKVVHWKPHQSYWWLRPCEKKGCLLIDSKKEVSPREILSPTTKDCSGWAMNVPLGKYSMHYLEEEVKRRMIHVQIELKPSWAKRLWMVHKLYFTGHLDVKLLQANMQLQSGRVRTFWCCGMVLGIKKQNSFSDGNHHNTHSLCVCASLACCLHVNVMSHVQVGEEAGIILSVTMHLLALMITHPLMEVW